jgi:hypothetical protein
MMPSMRFLRDEPDVPRRLVEELVKLVSVEQPSLPQPGTAGGLGSA